MLPECHWNDAWVHNEKTQQILCPLQSPCSEATLDVSKWPYRPLRPWSNLRCDSHWSTTVYQDFLVKSVGVCSKVRRQWFVAQTSGQQFFRHVTRGTLQFWWQDPSASIWPHNHTSPTHHVHWFVVSHCFTCILFSNLLSGKLLHNYGRSPFSMGRSTINGHFQ